MPHSSKVSSSNLRYDTVDGFIHAIKLAQHEIPFVVSTSHSAEWCDIDDPQSAIGPRIESRRQKNNEPDDSHPGTLRISPDQLQAETCQPRPTMEPVENGHSHEASQNLDRVVQS